MQQRLCWVEAEFCLSVTFLTTLDHAKSFGIQSTFLDTQHVIGIKEKNSYPSRSDNVNSEIHNRHLFQQKNTSMFKREQFKKTEVSQGLFCQHNLFPRSY